MSQEIANTEKMNISEVLNEAIISSIDADSKNFTPRSKSDNVKTLKGTATKKVIPTGRKFPTGKNNQLATRKRSLTMTDIKNKIPNQVRTPIKHMKQDSCSTTDYSPTSNEHPAEVMLTIRCRELQIRTFAKIFYSLWRKQKFQAENARDEVNQLQVQISFLKNLREKECASRDSMTNLADQLKSEIFVLKQQVSQLTKDRDTYQFFFLDLLQEYEMTLEHFKTYTVDLDIANEENQHILVQVKEVGDLMDARFIGLKRTLRWVEEIDKTAQLHLVTYNAIKRKQIEDCKTIEKLQKTNKILLEKLKSKEENDTNLKETIKELRKSLENSTAKSSDLKCEIKNIKLQLEFAELQLKEKEYRPTPWSILARKAARLSMYILLQVGLFPAF